MDKPINQRNFNVDTPDPVVLPDTTEQSDIPPQTPPQRQSIPHAPTTRNTVQTTQTPAQQQRSAYQASSTCNCGLNTGFKYEFEVIYKKTQQAKNPNSNEIRRDWLYLQLIGNINSDSTQQDRFLIYLK
jgi:hypothetical protein